MDIELQNLEVELCRIAEISATRVVGDAAGRPVELHVLARPGRHPKQLVRDIQSVALASLGIEIDRRIVSVVQLEEEDLEGVRGGGPSRTVFVGVTAQVTATRCLARVTLTQDGEEAVGAAEGSAAATAQHRLVAQATLDALRQLNPGAAPPDLDGAQIVRIGHRDVAVVTVILFIGAREHAVSGSALVRDHWEAEALARAVLNATNRRLLLVQ